MRGMLGEAGIPYPDMLLRWDVLVIQIWAVFKENSSISREILLKKDLKKSSQDECQGHALPMCIIVFMRKV